MSKWTKIVEIYKEFPKLSTIVKNIKNILENFSNLSKIVNNEFLKKIENG